MKTNKQIYLSAIVIISFLIALWIKLYLRPGYLENSIFYNILLGSSPSFFFIIGFSFIYPLLKGQIPLKKFIVTALFITLGSIVYEIEQLWTEGYFDFYDIIASICAGLISIIIYKIVFLDSKITD